MGKWTDKLYITHNEWAQDFGGHKKQTIKFSKLPFNCCALSLQPFENPVCTPDGKVFDIENIIPWIQEFGTNPITNEPLQVKDLIKLKFYKNTEGKYCCPVTYKIFTEFTQISALKPTGNVFSYEVIEELNLKSKNFKDLIDDVKFVKSDIITLQDPNNVEKLDPNRFYHIKNDVKITKKGGDEIKVNSTMKRVLDEMGIKQGKDSSENSEKETDSNTAKTLTKKAPSETSTTTASTSAKAYNTSIYSTGKAAASFTSTSIAPITKNELKLVDELELMLERVKGTGVVIIQTNLGDIQVELFCQQVPRACYNFIMLSKSEYYKGVKFHRNIKNFMIQGGDPTGTGRGGESYFKKDFEDEIKTNLSHDQRGLLSMANRGKDTNSSQFFITYRPCTHLDGKHSIFGKITGNIEVLDKMEVVPTDDDDKPVQEIKIRDILVIIDPFDEYNNRLKRKLGHEENERKAKAMGLSSKKRILQLG
ncbi:cyclophilin-like protein [Conidiobolus coronatus NRRL 28638]|uniref:Cyclophilin-like protein n=1 Tax=Conidiobolus coronatus (strain ATCC 28846 / CBS 209.66 / NRRL 28638) TaxID=796925 RepID=A0A137PDK3_CONC2|nr:cyclophilin-like protein [Conidiobolus coronatus NRRL 28638]|eukprot:KXN73055.1 cyclophilin-like protein [Conidiobolus coronatus NRRL 28638]